MKQFIEGFGLGLSTGGYCLAACLPFLAPYFLAEQRKLVNNSLIIIEFLTGRLIAYLLFGLVFGIIGEYSSELIDKSIVGVLLIVTSLILLFYGFVRNFPEVRFCKMIGNSKILSRFPLVTGFLISINICPPFLLGVSALISIGNVLLALIFSFGFFLATTLFLIPLVFSSFLSKFKGIQEIGQVATLIIGLYYLINGILMVI